MAKLRGSSAWLLLHTLAYTQECSAALRVPVAAAVHALCAQCVTDHPAGRLHRSMPMHPENVQMTVSVDGRRHGRKEARNARPAAFNEAPLRDPWGAVPGDYLPVRDVNYMRAQQRRLNFTPCKALVTDRYASAEKKIGAGPSAASGKKLHHSKRKTRQAIGAIDR